MIGEASAGTMPHVERSAARRSLPAPLEVFAFVSAVVCVYSMRRADPDLWGYLSSGRLFVEQGGLTSHDPFAYTSAGLPWVTFEYGAHIALWLAYRFAGPLGLIALKCLVGAVALYFLAVSVRLATRDPRVWVPVFMLCASSLSRFFLFRPQLFTFAFFAIFVAVLFRYLITGRAQLAVLPVVMLAWANVHGGFVAGLGAVGLAIAARASRNRPARRGLRGLMEGTKALWAVLGACAAVTFVNPMGARLWDYVIVELTHGTNRRYTVEWGPASLGTDAWSAVALTLIAVVFVTVTWFACTTANKTERPETLCLALTCVPLIVMAYVSVRHLPIAAIWTAPAIARLASRAEWSTAFRRAWFVLSGPAVLPACLTLLLVAVQPQPVISAGDGVLGRRNPCRAVAFMKANGVTGNVFSPLWWGSYVSWELYPAVRVSMDGRNISLFPDRMVIENFDFYLEPANAADLDAPLRYPTDYLLVPTDSPVLSRIEADGRWRPAFRDGDAALFVRTDFTGVFASAHPPLPCSAVFQ